MFNLAMTCTGKVQFGIDYFNAQKYNYVMHAYPPFMLRVYPSFFTYLVNYTGYGVALYFIICYVVHIINNYRKGTHVCYINIVILICTYS